MEQGTLHTLAARLEAAQLALIAIREKGQRSNRTEDVLKVDQMLSLGLQLSFYLALLMDKQTDDRAPLRDVREYCDIVDDLERNTL